MEMRQSPRPRRSPGVQLWSSGIRPALATNKKTSATRKSLHSGPHRCTRRLVRLLASRGARARNRRADASSGLGARVGRELCCRRPSRLRSRTAASRDTGARRTRARTAGTRAGLRASGALVGVGGGGCACCVARRTPGLFRELCQLLRGPRAGDGQRRLPCPARCGEDKRRTARPRDADSDSESGLRWTWQSPWWSRIQILNF